MLPYQLFRPVVRVRHHNFVTARVRIRFDGFINVEEKRILEIRRDYANAAALAPGQIARVQIGMILEFLDGPLHARAGGRFNDTCVVQDPGDRRGRNFGSPGHLF